MQETLVKYKVLLFGITRELIGKDSYELNLPSKSTVNHLLRSLKLEFPELSKLKSLVVAVNSEYAEKDQLLNEEDEIALIPPVSGG